MRGLIMKHFRVVIEREADTFLGEGWAPGCVSSHGPNEVLHSLRAYPQENSKTPVAGKPT